MFPGDTCQSGRRAKAWVWPQPLSRRGISHALHSPGSIRVKQETSGASDPSLASHQPHSKAAAESCHCIWEEADLQALRQISEEASPQPGRPLLPQATAAPAPDPPSSALWLPDSLLPGALIGPTLAQVTAATSGHRDDCPTAPESSQNQADAVGDRPRGEGAAAGPGSEGSPVRARQGGWSRAAHEGSLPGRTGGQSAHRSWKVRTQPGKERQPHTGAWATA